MRTQRFGVTSGAQNASGLGITSATSPNYNVVGSYNHFASGPNTTNNANFQHKQRQLSYSPNMQAAKASGQQSRQAKKRNISETHTALQPGATSMLGQGIDPLHLNNVPSRRSQSKNDKYKDSNDIASGLTLGSLTQPGNKLG